MAGTFDDIIRKVLGAQQPVPDESQPFNGSPLGPMIEDWLGQETQQYAPIAEGEMPPPDKWRSMTEGALGASRRLPYVPGVDDGEMFLRGPIPNTDENTLANDPDMPLWRGGSKNGSGIDI